MNPNAGRLPFLGAYALVAGVPPEVEQATYAALRGLPIGGIELPLAQADAGSPWIARALDPAWDVVVTCVPTVMQRLSRSPAYGLASDDAEGRRAALADVGTAAAFARTLADGAGRARVRAVLVHSAPGPAGGSVDSLARSLDELAAADLAGATIAVEHCDARRPGRPFHKGFLELEDELAALAGREDGRFGLTVNWGRSAIEGRSARTPVEHVAACARAGLLSGIMFSGATDAAVDGGVPWDDGHLAPRGPAPALAASAQSLLGPDEVRDTLRAGDGRWDFVGVKVTVRPRDAGADTRVAVAAAALDQVIQNLPER